MAARLECAYRSSGFPAAVSHGQPVGFASISSDTGTHFLLLYDGHDLLDGKFLRFIRQNPPAWILPKTHPQTELTVCEPLNIPFRRFVISHLDTTLDINDPGRDLNKRKDTMLSKIACHLCRPEEERRCCTQRRHVVGDKVKYTQ